MGYVSKEEYKKQIDQIMLLLDGKTDSIIKLAKQEMKEYSENMEYEKAAAIRDRIMAIERVSEKQKGSMLASTLNFISCFFQETLYKIFLYIHPCIHNTRG